MTPLNNQAPSILDTEVKLNRYWNFRSLVEAASNSVAANVLGKKTSQISSTSGPNPVRAIGDQLALEIEAAFRLECGELSVELAEAAASALLVIAQAIRAEITAKPPETIV